MSTKLFFYFWTIISIFLGTTACYANDAKPENLTTVYKTVGADGKVTFSDQPLDNAETLKLAPVPTIPAYSPPSNTNSQKKPKSNTQFSRYTTLSILSPADNSAFYSGNGEVDVLLDIQPPLIGKDQLTIFLDNKLIEQTRSLQTKLQSISRGSHQLTVKLISTSGKVLKENTSTFTVHRPSNRN